jgi:hypothetical protein
VSVICHGVVHNFLGVLKNIEFRLKIQSNLHSSTKEWLFERETFRESMFLALEAHILTRLDITMLYINFQEFIKISNFATIYKVLRLRFY